MTERAMQFIEQEHIPDGKPQVFVIANNAVEALAHQEKIERKGGMRLTNIMKESILGKVYDFKFKKSGDALDKLELRLSHRAMVQLFGRNTLAMLSTIGPPYAYFGHNEDGSRLTEKALAEWKGTKVTFSVGSLGYSIGMYVKDPVPPNSGFHRNKFFTIKDSDLADEIVAWQQACSDWSAEKRAMQLKVNAVLNSVTTFNSLGKTWPDGVRFYKHLPIDFPFRNQVPAVKVDDLNAALGL